MTNNQIDKKQLILEYKEKTALGAVYGIKNIQTGQTLLLSSQDLQGACNRFAFAQNTSSCVHPKLTKEWQKLGPKSFTLEVYEELDKNPNQTTKEFQQDLKLLEDIWKEKLGAKKLY